MIPASTTIWSALLSATLHVLILGWIANLPVGYAAVAQKKILKVALIQKAVPLPIGEGHGPGAIAAPPPATRDVPAAPASKPKRDKPKPPPKVKKITKPQRKLSPRPPPPPHPVVQKPRPKITIPPVAPVFSQPEQNGIGAGETIEAEGDAYGIASSGEGEHSSPSEWGTGNGQRRGGGGGGNAAQPNYNVNPKPPYPRIARRLGAQGVVTLRVFVRKDGSVGQAEVLRSSGFRMLDNSALKTVRSAWRFIPAQMDGLAIDSWVEVPIKFVLEAS